MKCYRFTVTLLLTTKRRRYYTVHKHIKTSNFETAFSLFEEWVSDTYPKVRYIIEGITRFPGAVDIFEGPRVRHPVREHGRGFLIK